MGSKYRLKKSVSRIFYVSLVLLIVLFASFSQAIQLNVTNPSTEVTQDETIDLNISMEFASSERAPVEKFRVIVEDPYVSSSASASSSKFVDYCEFDSNGNVLTSCSSFTITKNSGSSAQYGYGYGYDYGYSYGYRQGFSDGNLQFSLSWVTPVDNADKGYTIRIQSETNAGTLEEIKSFTVLGQAVFDNGFDSISDVERYFSITEGNSTSIASMTAKSALNFKVNDSYVNISEGTIINGSSNFSSSDLISKVSSGSGYGSGYSEIGTLKFGVENATLTFSPSITLGIYVGASYNGQTLRVLRSASGSGSWTTDGLVDTTCVVSNGVCSFRANKASTYSATTYSSGSSGSSSNNDDDDGISAEVYVGPRSSTTSQTATNESTTNSNTVENNEEDVVVPSTPLDENNTPEFEDTGLEGNVTGVPTGLITGRSASIISAIVALAIIAGLALFIVRRKNKN